MLRKKISLVLALALLVAACSEKPPIPENEFVDFYIRLQLIDAQYGTDAALQKQKADSLMMAFKIDRDLFDSTMSWYGKKPERWEKFFAEVRDRLAKMRPDYVRTQRR